MLTIVTAAAFALPAARTVEHRGDRYVVVSLDLREHSLELVGQGPDSPHRFDQLPTDVVATNAGIFHSPDQPVGLWIEGGRVDTPLSLLDGEGNFFLKPNGVFAIDAWGARVDDTAGFVAHESTRLATQSGPLLLDDGVIHPAFQEGSNSRKLRSGVGVSDPWTVHLVLSEGPVRFHDLATLFRDVLRCDDALYLDGTISDLRAPGHPAATNHDYAGFLVAHERPTDPQLQEGDLVFQRSRSAQSTAIAAATGSTWTHTGIIRIVDGSPWVLEAVQPVSLTPFAAWQARGIDGEVTIRRWAEPVWTDAARGRLDRLQTEWLGRPYDAKFAPGDDALYCSELVREAYLRAAGIELAPLRALGTYAVSEPTLREQMRARWGTVPEDQLVVAPSDLLEGAGLFDPTR